MVRDHQRRRMNLQMLLHTKANHLPCFQQIIIIKGILRRKVEKPQSCGRSQISLEILRRPENVNLQHLELGLSHLVIRIHLSHMLIKQFIPFTAIVHRNYSLVHVIAAASAQRLYNQWTQATTAGMQIICMCH